MSVLKLQKVEPPKEIKESFDDCLSRIDDIQGVVIVMLKKDHSVDIRTSSMSLMEKLYCKEYLDSWVKHYFLSDIAETERLNND